MGRTVPVLLARAASIFLAGMLLFAVFAHAKAENYDGYGVKPLSNEGATADYGLKPMPGGAPANAAPPMQAAPPANPVAAGYVIAPSDTYGYRPLPAPVAQQGFTAPPQQQIATRPATVNAPAPFGYRAGDGMDVGAASSQFAAYQPSAVARLNPSYVLGPGDKIKLTVYGETDLSGDFTIDGSGQLALPLVGQLTGAGYTAPQLEQTVAAALARGYLKSPRVSVEVSAYRPFYIIGAVNRPGEYPYVNHMNALNAVALAGGYQPNAVESVLFIRREGSNHEEEMPTDRTTPVYPGDVIRVHFTFVSDALSVFSPLSGAAGIGIAAATIH